MRQERVAFDRKDALELSRQVNHAEQACFTRIGNIIILVGKIGIPTQDTIKLIVITITDIMVTTLRNLCVKATIIGLEENMGHIMCLLPLISMHFPMHHLMLLDIVITFMVLLITIMPTVTWGKPLSSLGSLVLAKKIIYLFCKSKFWRENCYFTSGNAFSPIFWLGIIIGFFSNQETNFQRVVLARQQKSLNFG